MNVGVNQQCLLCPSPCLNSNYKLQLLCCIGISHAGEGRLFLLPAVMCSINPPDTLMALLFGSEWIWMSQPGFLTSIRSEVVVAGHYLVNEKHLCVHLSWDGNWRGIGCFSSLCHHLLIFWGKHFFLIGSEVCLVHSRCVLDTRHKSYNQYCKKIFVALL